MAAKVVKKGDRWEVLVDGLTYDYFEDESEAKKVAKFLEKNGSIEVEVIP